MTMTAHEQGAHFAMRRFMKFPDGGRALAATIEGLASGQWPSWYVETIGQDWHSAHPSRWPMEQVYAFMIINDWVLRGALAVVDIEVGEEPCADRRRAENQAALSSLTRFTAEVDQDQYCGDGDGFLSWDEPIAVSWRVPPGEWNASPEEDWLVGLVTQSGSAPLEIGTTKASTTALRLVESRSLARWPYGHKSIRLFLDTEQFKPLTRDSKGEARRYTPAEPLDQRVLPSPADLRDAEPLPQEASET